MDGRHPKPTVAGVPQGGPLSPVLANVVLDERDWELDRRGHRFVHALNGTPNGLLASGKPAILRCLRYADDCQILV